MLLFLIAHMVRIGTMNDSMGRNGSNKANRESALKQAAHDIVVPLQVWWHANARDLPWRFGRATPWGVLVSEVMSQQTQMSRVVPYWESWMSVWPDAASLAQASTAEVLTAWGRLGYPRRALRLQECARVVVEQYDNHLPQSYEELLSLPGIGDYTASAVTSFAFGKRIAVLDTNIRRVLSRVLLGKESRGGAASREERDLAITVLPERADNASMWNQAIMELGATVCTAKAPLSSHCEFLKAGSPGLGEKRTRPRQHFQGTDRQVRGLILNALRSKQPIPAADANSSRTPSVTRAELEALWPDHVQLDACIASLDEDALIELHNDGSVMFPS